MRITFVLPFASLAGGVRVVATYADHLTRLGHEVFVISQTAPRMPLRKRVGKYLTGQAKSIRDVERTTLLDGLGARHKIIDRAHPITADDIPDGDAVIATWWRTAAAVAALPESKGRKFYLLQDYEMFVQRHSEEVAASYALPLHKMAVSSYIRDQLAHNHGVSDVSLLPNAVDTDQFTAPARPKNTALRVGFLYKGHPRKRVSLAIAALERARTRLPELQVTAFGAGPPKADAPLPDWMRYVQAPPQDEIPKIYAACDLWLFPSEAEGFGLPLLEAMACRTPVLATDAGAASDLIDGENGKILPPDPQIFADEIIAFSAMSDPEWQRFSQAAHTTAQGYNWDEATDRLLNVISKS